MKNIGLLSLLILGLVGCDNTNETPVSNESAPVDCSRAEPQQPGYPNECLEENTTVEPTEVAPEVVEGAPEVAVEAVEASPAEVVK